MKWRLLGERRAISLLILGFYTTLFVLGALGMGDAWFRCFLALGLVYGIAFFGLAAEWFWGRWFAMGIGASGVSMALLGLIFMGWEMGLIFWGGMHLLIYLPLWGEKMADHYENRDGWRQRYGLDRHGTARLKRAVYGAAAGLPTLVIFALAPRQQSMLHLVPVAAVVLGMVGLLRMRFWGILLLGSSLLWMGAYSVTALLSWDTATPASLSHGALVLPLLAIMGVIALAAAISPFIIPAYGMLTREDS